MVVLYMFYERYRNGLPVTGCGSLYQAVMYCVGYCLGDRFDVEFLEYLFAIELHGIYGATHDVGYFLNGEALHG